MRRLFLLVLMFVSVAFSQISVDPVNVDFGDVPIGSAMVQTLTINNDGSTPVTVNITSNLPSVFSLSSTSCAIGANSSCTVTITFQPTAVGTYAGTITVSDGSQSIAVAVTGVAVSPLNVSPSNLIDFGSVPINRTATNLITVNVSSGSYTVCIDNAALPTAFSVSGIPLCGVGSVSLQSGMSAGITVKFEPQSVGSYSGSFSIRSGSLVLLTVVVSGQGTDPAFGQNISTSGGGCSVNPSSGISSLLPYLLIPIAMLVRRLRRP